MSKEIPKCKQCGQLMKELYIYVKDMKSYKLIPDLWICEHEDNIEIYSPHPKRPTRCKIPMKDPEDYIIISSF